jgi:hypothetical protein
VYAQVIFPSYTIVYYRPDAIIGLVGMVASALVLARILLHYSSRVSVQALLMIPFSMSIACPVLFFGISIDGTWLKLFCDLLLLGVVIVAIVRLNAADPGPERNHHPYSMTASLLTFLFLLACSVYFDQMAVCFASIPIGVSTFMVSPGLAQDHVIVSENRVPSSDPVPDHSKSTRGQGARYDLSLLLLAFLAGILLPIASSSFNLLYMNLLPLILSILPPVLAGAVFWGVYLLLSRYRKQHESNDIQVDRDRASNPLSASLRMLCYYSLALEGVALVIVLAHAPHEVWSAFAGVFVILFLSAIQFQITRKVQGHKENNLFYLFFLSVLMIGGGTILHAVKGSEIYSVTSPVSYDLVVVINVLVLAGCLVLTFVSLLLARNGISRKPRDESITHGISGHRKE